MEMESQPKIKYKRHPKRKSPNSCPGFVAHINTAKPARITANGGI
jgi:hypothetical protein